MFSGSLSPTPCKQKAAIIFPVDNYLQAEGQGVETSAEPISFFPQAFL